MVDKKKILKNSVLNSISNIILRVFQVIRTFLVASILGPTAYGLKNAIQLISDYGAYSHMGALNTLTKERQKYEYSDISKRDHYTNIIFSFLFIISIIFCIIAILCFIFLSYSSVIRYSILLIGFIVPVTLFTSFASIIMQSKNDFKSLSIINLLQGVIVLVFMVTFTYLYNIIGFFLGTLLAGIILLFLNWKMVKYRPKFIFDYAIFFKLIKKSIPLFLFSLSYLVFFSIDRVFIIFGFGATELGYYALGLSLANLMYFFINTLVLPVVPQIYQNIGDKKELIKYIIIPTKISQNLIYYVVFIILFLYPFLIFILPQYSSGFMYVNVLIFSILFYPNLIINYFIGKNKERFLLGFTIIFIILAAILNFLVILFNLPSIFIAVSTMITFFFYGTIMNLIGYHQLLDSWKLALKEIYNYLWPLGYALIGYGLLWLLAHYVLYGFMNYYVVKVIQAILFTFWYSPILWQIEKEHKILKIIWTSVKSKFGKDNQNIIE